MHSALHVLALAKIHSEEPCIVERILDRIVHPQTFGVKSVVTLGPKMKLIPVTKLSLIELRRVSGNCHVTRQLFHNAQELEVILLIQVIRVDARSLACRRKVRRITVNDLGTRKRITLKNNERISSDEGSES